MTHWSVLEPQLKTDIHTTDVCVRVCVADVHPEHQTYSFVKAALNQSSSSATSGRCVIPLWTEVEWIRLMLFTIKAQYNSLTDSNKSCFITKRLLVHCKKCYREKLKWKYMQSVFQCVLKQVWANNSHPGRPSFITKKAWKSNTDIFVCSVQWHYVQWHFEQFTTYLEFIRQECGN